ncbi:LytR/AlgR family response regulator transcription factor [Marinifilum sp.]|uniref:LytR/AlgR family response regulator transcription factor n=1 Tax=Marinifilum sp. TaxID=2033137 RepID=UPI003BAC0ED7
MNKLSRILIVETEYVLEEEILCRLFELGHDIVKTVYTANDALNYLNNNEVDIVLIEMNMEAELDGFQLAETIDGTFKLPCIFLSSNSIQANIEKVKNAYPSAILMHPYSLQQIHLSITIAINNYRRSLNSFEPDKLDNVSLDLLNNCLFLKKNNLFERVDLDEIYWCKAESNYTLIHTEKGEYIYSMVLKKIEEKLTSSHFLRVHRSYLVNLSKIDGFEGKMIIIDNTHIPVTKCYREKVFDLLHII